MSTTKNRNTYLYPPGAETYTISTTTTSSPFNGSGAQDWWEITDEYMGALVDPNDRAASLTYADGTGWSVLWKAGGTTDDDEIDQCPSVSMALSDIAPTDFSFETHAVDLLVFSSVANLNQTSPYQTGLGCALTDVGLTHGTGPAILSGNGTNVGVGILQEGNLGLAASNNDFIAYMLYFRRGSAAGLNSYSTRYPDDGTPAVTFNSSVTGGTNVSELALADLYLGIFCPVNTTSNLSAHTQTARCFIRITPLNNPLTVAEAQALFAA